MTTDVIAAIATASSPAAISAVRASGAAVFDVCGKIFRSVSGEELRDKKGYTAAFGHIVDGDETIDECVALVYRAPKSYTGEDCVELFIHGSSYVAGKALKLLCASGARVAEPGEFTKRAFLNGKKDLAQAESVLAVINAESDMTLRAANENLDGRTGNSIAHFSKRLTDLNASLAVLADYPDEDAASLKLPDPAQVLATVGLGLSKIIEKYDLENRAEKGVTAALCGKPNVGKSTVMNLLAGFERAIVTAEPGTTRDVVEQKIRLRGTTLRLFDTAGLRTAASEAESIGIRLAKKKLESADVILAVFDSSVALDTEDTKLCEFCRADKRPSLAIVNKNDLPTLADTGRIKEYFDDYIVICANDPEDADRLRDAIEKLAAPEIHIDAPAIASARQRGCVEEALAAVKDAAASLSEGFPPDVTAVLIDGAIRALGSYFGRDASEDVVNAVFSNFCVGK
ncbi:MAG: tRNA uridine-5-carboxymethylaminomethyl(34) synthesis GTPase MnmE [Clostridia bacterium]|nr:tRNA uridine-5-carboxymethylaminomethyl(34) synthesis GTPase MnmE [Clostridia bacterium]